MTDETPGKDELLGFLAEEGRHQADPEEHPSIEILSAYAAGELSEQEEENVQDHLVACRECSGFVLSFKEFQEPVEPDSGPVADFAFAAERRKPAQTGGGPGQRHPLRFAMAALLAFAMVGSSLYFLRTPNRPPVAVFLPSDLQARGAGDPPKPVYLQPGDDQLALDLEIPSRVTNPALRVVIRNSSGIQVFETRDLKRKGRILSLTAPVEDFQPGIYSITLENPGAQPTFVGRYRFQLVQK